MAKAETRQDEAVAPEGKKKGSPLVLILGVVVLLLAGGVGFMLYQSHAKASGAAAAAAPKPKLPELYQAMDPAFVVNFQDQDATRYLQVGVTLMTHDPKVIDAIKESDPVIRNALVMLFSSQTVAGLSTIAGKQKLQAQALDSVRKIINEQTGKPGVDALYFTSFVMQ